MTAGESVVGLRLRAPPANLEAEQALLGALLANNRAYDRVAEFLAPEHFADAGHARIYATLARMVEAGRVASAVTVKAELETAGALESVGGAAYLAQLLASMVGVVNAAEYGRVVRDCWLRRQLVEIGEAVVTRAFGERDDGLDAQAQIEAAEASLFALGGQGAAGAGRTVAVGDAAAEAIAAAEAAARRGDGLVGVTTGYAALDRMTGGWVPGELVILAARPSMGKTALGLGCAARAAAAGHRTLFVSIEMPAAQIAARLVAAVAGLDTQVMRRGLVPDGAGGFRPLEAAEAARLADAQARLAHLPLLIDDAPTRTVAAIRSAARRATRAGGLDLIVVDYLGQIRASEHARGLRNRVHEVSEIARDMKATARALGLPVLLLAQLNRGVEGRDDKRPGLADLRDSGEIEQEADAVLFLHREHYYLLRHPPKRQLKESDDAFAAREDAWQRAVAAATGRAEVFIAKQRNGRVGGVRLRYADALTWFTDETEHLAGGRPDALGPQARAPL